MNKIGQVLAMVQIAAGDATQYSESLADATSALVRAGADSDSLHVIVESLVESTREMEARNRTLQDRLNDSKREISQLKENLEAARTESLTDPLTTLANRKYFDMAITRLMADGDASGEPLSLLITDIDHFKKFNDTFGHLTGDQVLRLVAHGGEAERQGPGHRGALWRRGVRGAAAAHHHAARRHRRRAHPQGGDGQGADEALDRREPRPRHHLRRRRDHAARRHRRLADRPRRQLPLCGQALRPQSRLGRVRAAALPAKVA